MVLTEEQIIALVKAPENPALKDNREQQDFHKVHVTGEGYADALTQIIGYENVEQFKQKKLLTKPFTRPLLKYIIDAQSRWKTAQGTSKFYGFKNGDEKQSKEFAATVLSKVWKGSPIKDFINKFVGQALYTDFNGFFIVEKGVIVYEDGVKYEIKEGVKTAVSNDYEPLPYIIYKCVDDVYNYKVVGAKVEWFIYKMPQIKRGNATINVYRVIDDKFDYVVEVEGEGETATVTVSENVIEHKAIKCPVVPVTTFNKNLGNDYKRTSPIDSLIPLLDYYLNQYGEHVVSCLLHAHPIYYQVGQTCKNSNEFTTCDNGRMSWSYAGESHSMQCPSCKGTGANIHKDASTVIILPAKTTTGEAFNITNVAGYVSPPIDILSHQMSELDAIKKDILEAATGQIGASVLTTKTATETILNLKPLEDIISEIIDVVETVETNLTDIIGKMYYGEKYVGCEITYGRKLNLRDENLIIEEIKKAKESGCTLFYIKTLVEELIYSRFARSKSDLQRNIIANELEPFSGFTIEEVETITNTTIEQKYLKQNFNDYFQRFELENGDVLDYMKGTDLKVKIQSIKEVLKSYVATDISKLKQIEQTQTTQIS
jgi:hypothetical protein